MNIIGHRMKQRRKELKMSGAILAEKLGVIRNTISRWERGERNPSMESLSAIASALDTSPAYLLGEGISSEENQGMSIIDKMMSVSVYKIQEISSYNTHPSEPGGMKEYEKLLIPQHTLGVIDINRSPLAVIMPNNSMQGANMSESDRVIVNPAEFVNNGDPALIIYNGTPMVRWVCYKTNGDLELQAANPNHSSVIVEARDKNDPNIITIIGRSVMAIAQKDLKSAF